MNNTANNNKRIAKNTLLLYIRMLFTMIIGLYTSRVTLQALGFEDFGIYNVVGGVIVMFSFLMASLGGASSRFITYEFGVNNPIKLKSTVGNILFIHLIFAGVILILGESIGLWFVKTQLNIAAHRMDAVMWIYQFSIFIAICSIISIPYNAMIIAHERMKAFAYITLFDSIGKLASAFLIMTVNGDRLIIYGLCLLVIQIIDRFIYGFYCFKHFEESKTKIAFDKKQAFEIFHFMGWKIGADLAYMGYTQGLNLILNIFYGSIVNAARGIAVQVQSIVRNFCINFQMAIEPQLVKSYAQNDFTRMHTLLLSSSKFSYYLLLILSLPIIFETDIILHWWLSEVPEYTTSFVRIVLCLNMILALATPIVRSVEATGKLKHFEIAEMSCTLTILPIAYIGVKFYNFSAEMLLAIPIFIECITQIVRVKIASSMIMLPLKSYLKNVVLPILKVSIISPIIPFFIQQNISNNNLMSFVYVCGSSFVFTFITITFIGCTSNERKIILNYITNKIYSKK